MKKLMISLVMVALAVAFSVNVHHVPNKQAVWIGPEPLVTANE
jgi:hypothetical protein